MLKRCHRCKHLEEESSFKYNQRIKTGFDTKFFCRKCFKKQDIPYEVQKKYKSKEEEEEEVFAKIVKKREKNKPLTPEESSIWGTWMRTGVIKLHE